MIASILDAWREPLSESWHEEVIGLSTRLANMLDGQKEDKADFAMRLRRLSSMRLDDLERLRLHKLAKSLRSSKEVLPGYRPFRVLLVSNRTLSFFASDLSVAGLGRGILIDTVETEFDSVANLALNPSSEIPQGRFDAVFLLLDSDFFSAQLKLLDQSSEELAVRGAASTFEAVVAGLKNRIGAPVIMATLAARTDARISMSDAVIPGTSHRYLERINESIIQFASNGNILLFDLATIAQDIGIAQFYDPVRFFQAKTPFSIEFGPIVAERLSAQFAAMSGKSGRVLVLDLDNTIWGGVVADDGLDKIALGQGSPDGEAFLAIQRFALKLRERGVVIAVCSKNLESVAREPFRVHPEMLLKEEHISVFVANFEDKATNIARIAASLNLDPSSLVFLDDNAAERERVRSSLPHVMVPEIGTDPAYFVPLLLASGYFEHLPLTNEDIQRATAYEARAQAIELQTSIGDYETYLKSLQMTLTIAPFNAVDRARIAQLVNKSNQFNLTTHRYSDLEITAIENDPKKLGLFARLKDRFADHGIISVVIAEDKGDRWSIDTWVMSCRVLERGVEAAFMKQLIDVASTAGAKILEGVFKPTDRNALVFGFYPRLGFQEVSCDDLGNRTYHLPLPVEKPHQTSIAVHFAMQSETMSSGNIDKKTM